MLEVLTITSLFIALSGVIMSAWGLILDKNPLNIIGAVCGLTGASLAMLFTMIGLIVKFWK